MDFLNNDNELYKKKYTLYKNKYLELKNKVSKEWNIGDILTYLPTKEKVELLKIHYDDVTPYYTIKMSDNREKQTTNEKLFKE